MMVAQATILNEYGQPYRNGHANGSVPREAVLQALQAVKQRPKSGPRDIDALYDAAGASTEFAAQWATADRLDSDAANNRGVRAQLVRRSRHEMKNNGIMAGIVQTYCTDIIGIGPKLQVTTDSKEFNEDVEKSWHDWAKKIHLRRKLWCMCHAKVTDGEGFGIVRTNRRLKHPIKLDLVLFETEQCQTPYLPVQFGKIDGITFDQETGVVESYDVLKRHPGGLFNFLNLLVPETVRAKFVMHWFLLTRPGQHRGVPELTSTLHVGAASRRLREAVVAGNEVAADLSLIIKTTMLAQEDVAPLPPGSFNFDKRMAVALPAGYEPMQMKSEHPNAQYQEFMRSQIGEQARPLSMPYNKAACDSSGANFASGQLDHIPYYAGVDVHREDCADLVLDPLFAVWWEEWASRNYSVGYEGIEIDPSEPPEHQWDFPGHQVANEEARATARDKNIKNGSLSLGEAAAEDGGDFEERLPHLAQEYGQTDDEMRSVLLSNSFSQGFLAQAQVESVKAQAAAAVKSEQAKSTLGVVKSLKNGDITASAAESLLVCLCGLDPISAKAIAGGVAA